MGPLGASLTPGDGRRVDLGQLVHIDVTLLRLMHGVQNILNAGRSVLDMDLRRASDAPVTGSLKDPFGHLSWALPG